MVYPIQEISLTYIRSKLIACREKVFVRSRYWFIQLEQKAFEQGYRFRCHNHVNGTTPGQNIRHFTGDIAKFAWWRHQMETFSALLALCTGNSPVTGEFPSQRPVTWTFDVFFDLRLNKRLSKQARDWWFETSSPSLWRHCYNFSWMKNIVCWFQFHACLFLGILSSLSHHRFI